jgi:ribosomal protein S18 acetylase RimI-like enzyme
MDPTEHGRRTMHRLVDTAFEDHFGHEPMSYEVWERGASAECSDPSLYWIATVDGEPAAGLYGCRLPEVGYVDSLGTLREFRGRGLGRALLLTAFEEFRRRGVPRVSLAVDAASPTGALGLYESAGMSATYESLRYELPPAARKASRGPRRR